MKKGISDFEFFCVLSLFLAGGVTVVGRTSAWRDDWLIHLLLPVIALPLVYLYISLARRGRADACMRQAFGDTAGGMLLLAVSAVALLVSAAILNVYVDYIAMTPVLTLNRPFAAIAMGVMCYALARSPLGAIARLARILLPLALVMLAVVLALSLGQIDLGNLLPVAQPGVRALSRDMVRLLLLQTAPAFFFILQAAPADGGKNRLRAALLAAIAIAVIISLDRMKNLAVVGWPLIAEFRYPANAASSVLELGDLFERFEFLTSAALAMCQPVSAAMCIRFAEKSVCTVFTALPPQVFTAAATAAVVIISSLPREGKIIEMEPWFAAVMAIALVALPALMSAIIAIKEKVRGR